VKRDKIGRLPWKRRRGKRGYSILGKEIGRAFWMLEECVYTKKLFISMLWNGFRSRSISTIQQPLSPWKDIRDFIPFSYSKGYELEYDHNSLYYRGQNNLLNRAHQIIFKP
jgi:hypothetical protein